ncbi:MAG: exo-alpha-sialidase [Microlunatus sp.]|nr:exo-alpha-sialidase [Microlunatus sp.]
MATWDCVPYDPAGSRYATFRIPALLAADGMLLAFCEGRLESSADTGPIDIVLRRSADQGRSWDDLRVVRPAVGMTRGNPVPVLDPASGDVVLLSVQNGPQARERDLALGRVADEDARRVSSSAALISATAGPTRSRSPAGCSPRTGAGTRPAPVTASRSAPVIMPVGWWRRPITACCSTTAGPGPSVSSTITVRTE